MNTQSTSSPWPIAAAAAFAVLAAVVAWLLATSGPGYGRGREAEPQSAAIADGMPARDAGPVDAQHAATRPAGRGHYTAPTGSAFVYAIEVRSDATVDLALGGQARTQNTMAAAGRMTLRVAARRDAELLVEVAFVDLEITTVVTGDTARRQEALEAELARPTLVRMRDDGSVVGFRFADGVHPYTRNWLRSVLLGFRFVVPHESGSEWELEESDPTGIARARYRWESEADHRLGRVKLDYRSHAGSESAESAVTNHEVRAEAKAVFDPTLGWIASATVAERLRATADGIGIDSMLDHRASMTLESHVLPNGSDAPVRAAWPGAFASIDGADDLAAIADLSAASLQAHLVEGATLEGLLAELEAALAAEPFDPAALNEVFRSLSWLLRADEAAVDRLAAMLDAVAPRTADALLSACGAAGTAAAQELLCDVVAAEQRAAMQREAALESMFQIGQPGERAVATARGLATGTSSMRDTGLLLLGAFAAPSAESTATSRDALVQDLLAMEGDAKARDGLAHWLAALGNTAHPSILPAVARYLGDDDVDLRDRAVAAVGRVEIAAATDLLVARAGSEADVDVRGRIVELLGARADATAVRFTTELLAHEPSAVLRRAAIHGLGKRAVRDDVARRLLRRVAAEDPSPELRLLAQEIVGQ